MYDHHLLLLSVLTAVTLWILISDLYWNTSPLLFFNSVFLSSHFLQIDALQCLTSNYVNYPAETQEAAPGVTASSDNDDGARRRVDEQKRSRPLVGDSCQRQSDMLEGGSADTTLL